MLRWPICTFLSVWMAVIIRAVQRTLGYGYSSIRRAVGRIIQRILFLADRVALVNQATNAFKKHLPASSPVNLVTEKNTEGRIYLSTYPTMMGLINDVSEEQRKYGPGHFDLLVIDEAHRSVYQKYRAIFEYFDSLLVGLTATPKDEIDRSTYSLFNLESGVPTDYYDLETAVKDVYLVPPQAVSVPLKFQREGIQYNDLTEAEREQWDELDWDEDGNAPDRIEAAAVNQWLFNTDTVDKVLAHLMTRGQMVGRGTRLCPDLFGPDRPKEFFYLFDYCQNLEFFSQNPPTTEGSLGNSLSKRLFTARLELLAELGNSTEFDRFRAKARQFLRAHEDHITIRKLKYKQPLTAIDLSELERILQASGIGTPEQLESVKQMGLGIFIRSLVGLDRESAKQAFGAFLSGSIVSANQIEFINLIVDRLTHHSIMELSLLYESPFTDISHQGPEGIFSPAQVDALVAVLNDIRTAAA